MTSGIGAIIDGFFWQIASDYEEEEFKRARRVCWRYVCLLIPSIDPDTQIRVPA